MSAIDAWVRGKFPRYVVDKRGSTEAIGSDGLRAPVLGFVIDGVLYVHPDREPMVKELIERVGLAPPDRDPTLDGAR